MSGLLVITGASAGIGHATAAHFAGNGWQVVNLSRSGCDVPGATHISADLSDPAWPDTAKPALEPLLSQAGGSICLVHCAGLLLKDNVREVTADALASSLQVNVIAASQLNQLVFPHMEAGSSVIYVGSTLGEKAVAGAASYVTAKHAQIGLMRSTCQDLAGSGIHTTCVCPGFTDTAMLRSHVGNDNDILASLAGNVTMGRLIEPEEIAQTIWFAAHSPVINGAVLHANLGQLER
ncbi:MAG: SDR family oxidoreductase [Pseudomonadota bacterium]